VSDRDEIYAGFRDAVNLTAKQLTDWLESEESRSVGITASGDKKSDSGGGESKGHEEGRRIVDLLGTAKADLTDDDLAHMKRVTGYVHRHLAQGAPKHDVDTSRWRYSLMNWGHDPLRD